MNEYIIVTDVNCDLPQSLLCEMNIGCVALTFKFTDEEREYTNLDMPIKEFYDKMRAGKVAKTSAPNTEAFIEIFEKALKEGKDILYLGFSTGLSTTYNSARLAAEAMLEKYPDRRIITIDTLAASAGEGLIVYLTNEKKKAGASLDEAAEYAKSLIPRLCHWFTVDDLVYLKRGGRVSATSAFVGNALGIKPVMHVDDAGKLIPVMKVRGRRTSIMEIAKKYAELAETPESGTVFISHGDCEAEAKLLAEMLKKAHNIDVELITYVGASIGAHSGPGTIALFFVAKHK